MSLIRLEVNGWEKSITFSASHILPGHEKCGRMHGHNYAVHFRVEGEPKEEGLVYDFIPIKRKLRELTEAFDHRILIPKKSSNITIEEKEVSFNMDDHRYVFPKRDCVILELERTTAENLAKYVLNKVVKEMDFPNNVKAVEIGVDESRGQGAWARRDVDE